MPEQKSKEHKFVVVKGNCVIIANSLDDVRDLISDILRDEELDAFVERLVSVGEVRMAGGGKPVILAYSS